MSVYDVQYILRDIEPLKNYILPKLLINKILMFAEKEGFLELLKGLGQFSLDDLYIEAEKKLGYAFKYPVHKKIIFSLLNILIETEYVKKVQCNYCSINSRVVEPPEFDREIVEKFRWLFDSEVSFYSNCIEYTGNFLKGSQPLYSFNPECGDVWENFLGNYEFSAARKILLQCLRIEDEESFNILDLCYGRGHGLELICNLYPRTKVTAIDFTDIFQNKARKKVENVQKKTSSSGIDVLPVDWVHSAEWKGFGDRLPFEDKTFDLVFFACGDPYIPPPKREGVYGDIYRILKPGGVFGLMSRSYPDPEGKYITNNWAKMAIYIHDLAEGVCENWHGFYGIEETMQMFKRLGFLPRLPFFEQFSILDYTLWGMEKPNNG